MRSLLSFLMILICQSSIGQNYSTFYGTYDVSARVQKDVNVSGNVNVNKTVKTIDYAALAQANAMKEQNRIERLRLSQEYEAQILLKIAQDPAEAHRNGAIWTWKLPKEAPHPKCGVFCWLQRQDRLVSQRGGTDSGCRPRRRRGLRV